MANESFDIPIAPGNIFSADPQKPVEGGHSRFVPNVPVGDGERQICLPCIWKSHKITKGRDAEAVNECLLLISRDPITTLRAEVSVDSWQHFGRVLVEW